MDDLFLQEKRYWYVCDRCDKGYFSLEEEPLHWICLKCAKIKVFPRVEGDHAEDPKRD